MSACHAKVRDNREDNPNGVKHCKGILFKSVVLINCITAMEAKPV